MEFFILYIKKLAKYEEYYFKVKFPNFLDRISKRNCLSSDPYDMEIWNMENMKMFDVYDPIMLGFDDPSLWKFRFYEYYYGVSQYQSDHIENMCKNYTEGISWTLQYYFQKCVSYEWFYEYYHAPFVSDLVNHIKNINNIQFKKDTIIITPYVQLLAVLPSTCHTLLPKKYGSLMCNNTSPIIDLYPKHIALDMLYKDSYHKCIPLVPNIDINRIINATNKIKLAPHEQENNYLIENP